MSLSAKMRVFGIRGGVSAALACVLVSACGGGGGGGPGSGITTPAPPSDSTSPPPPPPPPPAPAASAPPSATSAEYKRNWGLGAVHASAAFDQGGTGRGIIIAVIDTGVDSTQADLQGRISSASTDINTRRHAPEGADSHGTEVAGVIAANFNGMGTIGIAYEATILGIRADDGTATTCPTDGCQFYDSDLAAAVDYAVAHGARVINMSLGGDTTQSLAFEAALTRAKSAGVVVVASAGNDGAGNPGWPARYAVDSRYAGYVIAAGASDVDGTLASFSNRAGVAANGYLVAPGVDIITSCDTTTCWRVSGTSFSSPEIAGAVAVLLQAFPNLSGPAAIDILLRSADDKGAAGTDAVWGRGMLNMERAFQPIGTLSMPVASGEVPVTGDQTGGAATGAAFGDAIRTSQALHTVARDDYRRPYKIDLAGDFASGKGGLIGAAPATRETSTTMALAPGAQFALKAETPYYPDQKLPDPLLRMTRGDAPQSVALSGQVGRLSFAAWSGKGGVAAPAPAGGRDVFRAIASPDHTVSVGYQLGDLKLSAEQGGGMRREFMAITPVKGPSYVSATALWSRGATSAALTVGSLEEPQGPLGSDIAGHSLFAMPASTDFAALSLEHRLSGVALRAEAGFGRTSVERGFMRIDNALSSEWKLSAYGQCAFAHCSSFGLELEQPLRVEDGVFTTVLANIPARYFEPATFSVRRIDASPSGRQLNLRAVWRRDFESWGSLQVRGVASVDNGHQAASGADLGAAVDWKVKF